MGAVCRLELPIGRRQRRLYRLKASISSFLLWIVLGMFGFSYLEDWRHLDALYFCVITLTTIGLGDWVPTSPLGVNFHLFYCIVGLAILSMLLGATAEYLFDFKKHKKFPHGNKKTFPTEGGGAAMATKLAPVTVTAPGRNP